jgi:hypothetical protein
MERLTSWIASDSNPSPDTALLRVLYVAAVICLVIVVYQTYRFRSVCDSAIEGFWAGEPQFVRDSSLRDFQWSIAPKNESGPNKDARSGFLIVADRDGKLVASNTLTLRVSDLATGWGGDVTCTATVDVDGHPEYELPRDVIISCDLGGKQMEVRGADGSVVFRGYRDNSASKAFLEDWNDSTADGDDAEKI